MFRGGEEGVDAAQRTKGVSTFTPGVVSNTKTAAEVEAIKVSTLSSTCLTLSI